MLLDLTELSSYLPLVSSFEFGNASGKLFPCTEGRVRTIMTSAGTPRAGAFRWSDTWDLPSPGLKVVAYLGAVNWMSTVSLPIRAPLL